jgi:outer membrane protein assembly factor BamD (BamD/ComL family)
VACVLAFPYRSPAPLVYRPGEGWTYEKPGETGDWQKTRAKDQLEVAQKAFEADNHKLAMKAAQRTVNIWPLSDYAPEAQYLIGRCYEAEGQDQKAFTHYQRLLEKYPKIDKYNEVLQRQYEIANRFLDGQWGKLWSYIPFPQSSDKTADMFEKVVKNGPYSDFGPKAQMNIGAVREKQEDYPSAVKAYERAADRYADRELVASDALFRAGLAYQRQARTAEYDQTVASKAISTFDDFSTLHPNDNRMPEVQLRIQSLKTEQARGAFETAKFYEKRKKWAAAKIYYNEAINKDRTSVYAEIARLRLDDLGKRFAPAE